MFLTYPTVTIMTQMFDTFGISVSRSKPASRPEQLDRETRKLGRSLVKTGEDDDEEYDDDDDDDYDAADMECLNVNVVEAQKLVGVNINPAVYVMVGDEKRHTTTQKSTNCPFYNEVGVVHKKALGFLMTRIGTFKIDISTVYSQPDHRFYHKWAPLTDPKDTRTGVKGYVKCTLSVVAKGDFVGMPSIPSVGSQNDEIEKNLLLPKRMPVERPWAKFLLKVYKAEGLPSMNAGFLGSFSKMMGEKKVFIDPYVQITFAGQQGETSVETNTNVPQWNEQISFIEQFPPLARRIKIQIMDDANIGDVAVATHFLDLQQISNPNRNGYHPTFGPSWINLYGSPQNSALRDIHRDLNEGLGEGIFYRGRILISLSVEVYTSPAATVVEKIHPLPENFVGQKEEFLLFASLFEVTMIDPSIGTRLVTFELSIGNYGKAADVVVKSKKSAASENLGDDRQPLLESSEDELEKEDVPVQGKSVTSPRRPQPTEYDRRSPDIFFNKLLIQNSLVKRFHFSLRARRRVTNRTVKEKLGDAKKIMKRLRFLSQEPQSTLPDVFLWMMSGGKRIAYARIPAHTILFSMVEEEKGKDCGKLTTIYMKTPGGPLGEIFAKLEVYLWLGVTKYAKNNLNSLPAEFRPVYEEGVGMSRGFLCGVSVSTDSRYFQLRAHVYQARGILAADDNGLSDPFAKVVLSTHCQVTRETLSPTWCELLLFEQILIEGSKDELRSDPPVIVISLYDWDKIGSPEPLGRAFAEPELKFVEEAYKKPALQFFDITKGKSQAGELLAAFELIELDYANFVEEHRCYVIPEGVRPVLRKFRIEVLFWGLRNLKRVNLFEVEKPQVLIECAGQRIQSEEIENYKLNPNFKDVVKHFDVELPELVYLHPPLTIFIMEQRAFGRLVLVGTHVVQSLMNFAPKNLDEWKEEEEEPEPERKAASQLTAPPLFLTTHLAHVPLKKVKSKEEELEEESPEKEELDWWSKYYASLEELQKQVGTLILYKSELENEFNNFMDWLHTFPIYKGKANYDDEDEDEDERTMGKYKGSFLIYPILPEEEDAEGQITNGIPKNLPIKVLVRVYVVKATNLAPTDPNGKADPYIVVRVGQQQMDTKDRYIPKQLHPVFGEVFELTLSFPLETELTLMVFDHDLVGSDDLIGETHIDLENRFYSRHRAGCGIALYYDKDGYNQWRDAKKPSAILAELCRKNGIPSPEYREAEVKVLNKIFKIPSDEDLDELDEHKALSVLHRWGEMREFCVGSEPLVPEHVEVRSLMNTDKPGLPQGHLHMWVDMFPVDVPAPAPVNIKPRLPVSYELRVIIWNTDDVVLDDVNPFTGEPSTDIYVKGWIKGLEGDKQETDVHFNSLTGEGNFNWRFVFRFDYLPTEKEITYKKKESIFSLDESEFRQPAVLVLQIWDYDRIAANDFLGSIELRLNDMVRAAKASEHCTVKMAKDKASPRFSIFRSKRMRGWWPVIKLKSQEDIERELREGKVEAEFQLVTVEEAEKNPVGKARKEPEPLEKPNRPKTSFNWFVNPMKTFVFFIWKKYKKYIIALVILAILTLFLALILYTLPNHISQLIVNG
uniref:Fer-1-like protein 4 n=1 Tax=Scleropages formosus TaxID=113540 RepID=A0A8C9VVM1_SCLFO